MYSSGCPPKRVANFSSSHALIGRGRPGFRTSDHASPHSSLYSCGCLSAKRRKRRYASSIVGAEVVVAVIFICTSSASARSSASLLRKRLYTVVVVVPATRATERSVKPLAPRTRHNLCAACVILASRYWSATRGIHHSGGAKDYLHVVTLT